MKIWLVCEKSQFDYHRSAIVTDENLHLKNHNSKLNSDLPSISDKSDIYISNLSEIDGKFNRQRFQDNLKNLHFRIQFFHHMRI